MTVNLSSLMSKYEPTKLADYTTFNLKTMAVIHGYPKGTLTRPLLLVGPPGGGKTQLAKLLAAEMAPDMSPADIRFVDVSEDPSVKAIRSVGQTVQLFARNTRNLRAVILDEVHEFSTPAMSALKGMLTKYPTTDRGVFFVMTTNHLSGLSEPVRDRCLVLEVPATTVDDVLPMARRVLDGEKIPYAVEDLRAALTKDSSGLATFRDMWGVIEDIVTRMSMP
ncbi:MoxR-like ATPase [Rhizobium sp. SG_E_25_P2]|uniref:AAA family ATPase n=1 Tax=Rhizobium sp. SG_E_25_P2 TaxID=2879942 RepID=UPI00247692DA|nr:AAA family ATPase [Rhizobium sp. SG_E_25_P2]MDH6269458.1 MoxR-like ATPase [Rhizobium sp. SG_E_25_P2]